MLRTKLKSVLWISLLIGVICAGCTTRHVMICEVDGPCEEKIIKWSMF